MARRRMCCHLHFVFCPACCLAMCQGFQGAHSVASSQVCLAKLGAPTTHTHLVGDAERVVLQPSKVKATVDSAYAPPALVSTSSDYEVKVGHGHATSMEHDRVCTALGSCERMHQCTHPASALGSARHPVASATCARGPAGGSALHAYSCAQSAFKP
eukprot:2274600-Amphidinium_carterae.1